VETIKKHMHASLFTALQLTIYKLYKSTSRPGEQPSVNELLTTIKNSASVNMSFTTVWCICCRVFYHWRVDKSLSVLTATETRGLCDNGCTYNTNSHEKRALGPIPTDPLLYCSDGRTNELTALIYRSIQTCE